VAVCKRLVKAFGKPRFVSELRPGDFEKLRAEMAKRWGPVRLGNEINRTRIVFNYAYKSGLIDKPMVYGEGFRRPSKIKLRQHRHAQGVRMFEAQEIRRMLGLPPWAPAAGLPLSAMILLGVNAGFGNADVGTLPLEALDLDGGWVTFPRPKTGIQRWACLWPETIHALRAWLAQRPEPKDKKHAGLVFLTAKGDSWAKDTSDNPVSKKMGKLLKALDINSHRNLYALRHTFQTIGDESGDFIAVRSIMGHASNDIADHYRERISDERLRKVTEHVRQWLIGDNQA
jgi:integrase